ncbi:fibronectin type III-like domain-contianing protein [Cohnella fermenti]|uniref:Fibronectin type III-like domain-containing protein n=1 Tax=Cohnella fermenti TaxID=2565925 RepID=A0A4S4BHK1_9BACL|nr:hypothetical protein E6C55_31320 [Cohnella fermenti]
MSRSFHTGLASVQVTNTGGRVGQEVVQLYVKDVESSVIRPEKELKGFAKVELQPGETKTVRFELNERSFAFYDVELKDWRVETGEFEIGIGSSSRDIRLTTSLKVTSTTEIVPCYHRNTTLGELMSNPATVPILAQLQSMAPSSAPESDAVSADMMMAMMRYMPLRALLPFTGGVLTEEHLTGLLQQLNAAVQANSKLTEGTSMTFNGESKIGDLLANEMTKAMLEKNLPGISTNPMIEMAKGFTLTQLGALPQAGIPADTLAALLADWGGAGSEVIPT